MMKHSIGLKKISKFIKEVIIVNALGLIILVGIALRFVYLGEIPAGFHADEAAYGYNAYSILKTGMDEYGNKFPLALESFGEYKPAFYAYLTIPFVAILDLNPLSARIVSALFGSITVIALYFFVFKLLKSRGVALASSLLLAISPWHINLSRTTSEVVVAAFFAIMMLICLENVKRERGTKWVFITLVFALLSVISYTASLFFIPLLIFISVSFGYLVNRKHIFRRENLILFGSVSFIVIGYGSILSASRFTQVNVFSHPETQLKLEEQIRQSDGQNVLVTRAMHNKIVNFGRTILKNQAEYLSFNYLFLEGGFPMRQHIPDVGLFYLWQIPFLFIGIFVLLKEKRQYALFFLSWWLVLLIPSALTFDEIPNVYRSLIVIFPIIIFISAGIISVLDRVKSSKLLSIFMIFLLLIFGIWEFSYYINQYYLHQEKHQPYHRGYAYQELSEFISSNGAEYERIVITKGQQSPYIYLLFFTKYDPHTYIGEGSPRDLGHEIGFSNLVFSDFYCPLNAGKDGTHKFTGNPNYLYVNKGDCVDPIEKVEVVRIIKWQDGSPAFKLLRYIEP